jgi:tRNA threonylcarbamoyladenosine modification (KEOPS) complex  Pcc1 subunit
MKATVEIECEKPLVVAKAIEPEMDKSKRFSVKLDAKAGKVLLTIESPDISGLLAGVNSYVTLIKTSINTMEE